MVAAPADRHRFDAGQFGRGQELRPWDEQIVLPGKGKTLLDQQLAASVAVDFASRAGELHVAQGIAGIIRVG